MAYLVSLDDLPDGVILIFKENQIIGFYSDYHTHYLRRIIVLLYLVLFITKGPCFLTIIYAFLMEYLRKNCTQVDNFGPVNPL